MPETKSMISENGSQTKTEEPISTKPFSSFQKKAPDSIITIEKSEGRRVCPKCNEEKKSMIHESIDKSNIIMDYPRVYGKKYKCGSCGAEWREK